MKKPRWRRRSAWFFGFLLLMGIVGWMAREPITARIEKAFVQQLNESGIYPRYANRSWLPWRGLRLENLVLHRDAEHNHPVIEVSELAVDLPWLDMLTSRGLITRWRTKDASFILHDDAGVVTFQHVRTKILLHAGQVEIRRLQFRHDPLSWDLSGKISLGPSPEQKPATPTPFTLDLTIPRSVLSMLDIKPGTGPFAIQGTFSVDLRGPTTAWQANLNGNGKSVEWRGVPFREAEVRAQLSSQDLQLASTLQFAKGSAKLTASYANWDTAPLLITGQLSDARGRVDAFSGSYDSAARAVTVKTLSGKADLLEFGSNFPLLVPSLPAGTSIRTVPEVLVKDFTWSAGGLTPGWSLGLLELQSPADLIVTLAGQPLTIDHLAGQLTFHDKAWQIHATTGRLSWRNLSLRESKIDGNPAPSQLKLDTRLGLAKGSMTLAVSREKGARAPYFFTGSLADSAGQTDHFAGRYEGAASTALLSELNGKANLVEFASNFPPLAAQLPEHLEIRTFPEIALKDFSYSLGKRTENWTLGGLQLRSPADLTVTLQGHPLTIDELTGLAAYNGKAWRLSNVAGRSLSGRFTVNGAYSDGVLRDSAVTLTKLPLKQLRPWMTEPKATPGEALLSLNYRGALGSKPAQLTGSGTMELENAPLVKVPLLDETYTLFSAFLPEVKRNGTGRLTSAFSATNGVLKISEFSARGEAVTVTATGTLDLVQRVVSARATGNLRGAVGLVTSPLTHTLEMEVSGPLDHIRIRPIGTLGVVDGTVSGAAKAAGEVLKEGVTAPLQIFDWLKGGTPPPANGKK